VNAVAKVKIEDSLYERVQKIATVAGYASADEFIVHMIEKELGKMESTTPEADQAVIERLRGLGYLE
jgi:hypothetical protein